MKLHHKLLLPLVTGLWLWPIPITAAPSLVDFARQQIGVTTSYDPAYRKIPYPGGDVATNTGVCSDVVVRAFRGLKLDLQKAVHEDMKRAFAQYPQRWGLKRPDPNIDHRRVPNLMTYFQRRGWSAGPGRKAPDFRAGDVVAWDLGNGITHIGIVSDRRTAAGVPLVIHNIGRGTREEDVLFQYTILGQYRPVLEQPTSVRRIRVLVALCVPAAGSDRSLARGRFTAGHSQGGRTGICPKPAPRGGCGDADLQPPALIAVRSCFSQPLTANVQGWLSSRIR